MTSPMDRRTLLGASAASLALALTTAARAEDAAKADALPPQPSILDYAKTPLISHIALSPDGTRIALITPKGDQSTLIDLSVDDFKGRALPLGSYKIRSLFWGDNSHVTVVTSTTTRLANFVGDKHEFSQAHIVDIETGKGYILFSNEKREFDSIVMGDLQRIKVNDEYRITASNYLLRDGVLCLYSFSLTNPMGLKMGSGTGNTEGWVIRPDGYQVAYSDFHESDKLWELFFNFAAPDAPPKFRSVYKVKSALASPDLLGLGRDGKSVLIVVYTESDNPRYHEIAADGQLSEPLDITGEGKPRSALFHPTTGCLVGFARHNDWFSYDYFDPVMNKLTEAVTAVMGDDYRTSLDDFAEDPRKMIIYGESSYNAGSYYYADFSTGKTHFIANNYPQLPEEWITQKQAITYKAADGLEIHGYLTLPPFKAPKGLPLVVLPHGGPQARDYIDFDWQVQALASRGYAVLQPNFRGSAGYGEDFIKAGHGEWGRKMQTDLSDGVRWLVAQGTVDPKRVAILGASYGGYAALAGATMDVGVYVCAIDIAGVSGLKNFLQFVSDATNTIASSAILYWKDYWGDRAHWDDISPTKQAHNACCPILIIHGTDDTVVPYSQSQEMEAALKAAGKEVEFVTYKGQDHWETIESSRVSMMQAAMDFLAKHNPAT